LRRGFAEGFAKGFAEGLAEARAEATARFVLTVLRARGLAVPDAARERILSEKDRERLERWLEKAVVAAVLDEPS
jgi:flagellar biosynthesis/type III secretory pathway protein FliH